MDYQQAPQGYGGGERPGIRDRNWSILDEKRCVVSREFIVPEVVVTPLAAHQCGILIPGPVIRAPWPPAAEAHRFSSNPLPFPGSQKQAEPRRPGLFDVKVVD
jgi:hypothetical protein